MAMKIGEYFAILIGGALFGFGLAYSGAAVPEVVLSFLRLEDFGLALVIGSALALTILTFNLVPKFMHRAVFGHEFTIKDFSVVLRRTLVGGIVFGIGWGLAGICPGTSFAAVGMGNYPVLYGIVGIFTGALFFGLYKSR